MIRCAQLLILGIPLLVTSNALAFCRTTTCEQADESTLPEECDPGFYSGTCQMAGAPLYWEQPCTSFSVNVSGSAKLGIAASQLETIGRKAFDNWLNVVCPGGGKPNFEVKAYPQVECDEARYNSTARNQNVWVFRDEYTFEDPSVIALTTTKFVPSEGKDKGKIYDADMEFNSFAYRFVADSDVSNDGYKLTAVVQHETGHVFGLAHSDVSQATMSRTYNPRIDMGTLAADDVEGICTIYPPVTTTATSCDAEPRHGFSTLCNEPSDEDAGCSCAVVGKTGALRGYVFWAALLGLLAAWSQRTHAPRTVNPEPRTPNRKTVVPSLYKSAAVKVSR